MKRKNIAVILIILILAAVLVYSLFFKSESLVGGCAGVALEYMQECCDNWAQENNIVKIQCVGEWEIKDNKCSWKCIK